MANQQIVAVNAYIEVLLCCIQPLECMVGPPLHSIHSGVKYRRTGNCGKLSIFLPSLCLYVLLHWNFNFSPREQYGKLSVSNSGRSICFLKGFGSILWCSFAFVTMKLRRSCVHVHVQPVCEYCLSKLNLIIIFRPTLMRMRILIRLSTLMRIRIRLFALMRIWIRLLTLMRIQIPLFTLLIQIRIRLFNSMRCESGSDFSR